MQTITMHTILFSTNRQIPVAWMCDHASSSIVGQMLTARMLIVLSLVRLGGKTHVHLSAFPESFPHHVGFRYIAETLDLDPICSIFCSSANVQALLRLCKVPLYRQDIGPRPHAMHPLRACTNEPVYLQILAPPMRYWT